MGTGVLAVLELVETGDEEAVPEVDRMQDKFLNSAPVPRGPLQLPLVTPGDQGLKTQGDFGEGRGMQ
jgi:hypothetical protein